MIQQTFEVVNVSYGMLWYKRENLILDTAADKKLNATTDKAVDTNKERDIAADKDLNTAANKAVDTDKRRDAAVGKQPNAMVELSMLIKDQIIRRIKLRDWIGVG